MCRQNNVCSPVMKKALVILPFIFWSVLLFGQFNKDSFSVSLRKITIDTTLVDVLLDSSEKYLYNQPDITYWIAQQCQPLAEKIHYKDGEARVLFVKGKVNKQIGNYPAALELYKQSQKIYESTKNRGGIAGDLLFIGEVYAYQSDHPLALSFFFQAMDLFQKDSNDYGVAFSLLKISDSYEKLSRLDSCAYYLQQIAMLKKDHEEIDYVLKGRILYTYGNLFLKKKNYEKAVAYYRQSLDELSAKTEDRTMCQVMLSMAGLFQQEGREDSSVQYARQSLLLAQKGEFMLEVFNASEFLYRIFKKYQQYANALTYLETSNAAKDNLFSRAKIIAIENQRFQDELEKKQDEFERQTNAKQMKIYTLLAALTAIFIIASILWRNNKQKQKANDLLQQQKQEVQKTLTELRTLQQQLIHAEKMASLGEVTAGIAHEIQNPLNFITNFSELSTELLAEMQEDLRSGHTEDALCMTDSLKQSLEKINQHGKRADAIVKNMLQHSRKHTGTKEHTDINALVDEYLQLSYEAMRAKDKSFHAILETHFESGVEKVEMIPQDMGRVLLNLFNNAFYSVHEKMKASNNGYEPTIQVVTRRNGSSFEIRIRDNGMGIPEKVVDKIYQPFFTTKPTGEGTGLGLSLSYDIVTKVHNGTMDVNTKQGEYAEFVIELPFHQS